MSHAFLAPSASSRWLKCTASPGFIARLTSESDVSSSVYADEGTRAHELAEDALIVGVPTESFEDVPEDMREHIQNYIDFATEVAEGTRIESEKAIPLFYAPDSTGTADLVIFKKEAKTLITIDLKYGAGVSIQAEENTQLSIYMRSIIEQRKLTSKDVETIQLYIYQPRVIGEQAIRFWEVSFREFMKFTDEIGKVAKQILENPDSDKLTFHASEKGCRFCPVSSICKTHVAMLLDETPAKLEIVTAIKPILPPALTLTVEQLSAIYENSSLIKKWLDSIPSYLYNLTSEGKETGYKIVGGRKGNRQWEDEAKAAQVLSGIFSDDQIYDRSLISPTQAEKILKKVSPSGEFMEEFESVICRSSGKPVLAKIEDPRPALELDATKEFEALDN